MVRTVVKAHCPQCHSDAVTLLSEHVCPVRLEGLLLSGPFQRLRCEVCQLVWLRHNDRSPMDDTEAKSPNWRGLDGGG